MHSRGCVWQIGRLCGSVSGLVEGCISFLCVWCCVCVRAAVGCLLSRLLFVTWYVLAMFIQSAHSGFHLHTHTHTWKHAPALCRDVIDPSSMATVSKEARGKREGVKKKKRYSVIQGDEEVINSSWCFYVSNRGGGWVGGSWVTQAQ